MYCDVCKFWNKTNLCNRGQCRKRAPQYNLAPKYNTEGHVHHHVFPETRGDDWCGDFEFRIQQGEDINHV